MKPYIVVIGSSNTDMIIKLPHLPGPGETVLGGEFTSVQGGKGANQAIASARAGGDVTFISSVGDDPFGRKAIDELRKEGIDTSWIKIIKNTPTGIALINVADTGENSISVAPGANSYLLPEDIMKADKIIMKANMVLVQLEIPIETVMASINLANSHKVPVILNPAPAKHLPQEILNGVDIITPNEKEAFLIANLDPGINDLNVVTSTLKKRGLQTFIITLGDKGAKYYNKGKERHVNGFKVEVVDTTAAGDTFNGFLAVMIADGAEMEYAIRVANMAASLSVTRLGAQTSIPYIAEVIEQLKYINTDLKN